MCWANLNWYSAQSLFLVHRTILHGTWNIPKSWTYWTYCNKSGVIEKLDLKKCCDTVVGSPGLVRGISGGERKRTNVALSLLGFLGVIRVESKRIHLLGACF